MQLSSRRKTSRRTRVRRVRDSAREHGASINKRGWLRGSLGFTSAAHFARRRLLYRPTRGVIVKAAGAGWLDRPAAAPAAAPAAPPGCFPRIFPPFFQRAPLYWCQWCSPDRVKIPAAFYSYSVRANSSKARIALFLFNAHRRTLVELRYAAR